MFNKKEYAKKYYIANAERLKACSQQWRENNPEKVRKQHIEWRKNHPEYDKQWRDRNPIKCREAEKKWRSDPARANLEYDKYLSSLD